MKRESIAMFLKQLAGDEVFRRRFIEFAAQNGLEISEDDLAQADVDALLSGQLGAPDAIADPEAQERLLNTTASFLSVLEERSREAE